jgi:hypothetical protein
MSLLFDILLPHTLIRKLLIPQIFRLTAEFETQGSGTNGTWVYWSDGAHTQEISIPEIAAKAEDIHFRFYMGYE